METILTQLIKKDSIYKLNIPADVEAKIRHLCSKVFNTEWSGNLFYKMTGTFADDNIEITCVDILPMDIGSSAYTEFEMSPEVATYMVENPELFDCKMGLIHSHQSFGTFFSGTDTATLQSEGQHRNHFLSLIVNNAGVYTAAITRKKIVKKDIKITEEFEETDFNPIAQATTSNQVEGAIVEYFMLDINIQKSDYQKSLDDKLDAIRKAKTPIVPAFPSNSSYIPNYGATPRFGSTTTPYYKDPAFREVIDSFPPPQNMPVRQAAINFDNEIEFPETGISSMELGLRDFPEGEEMLGVVPIKPQIINAIAVQLLTGNVILPTSLTTPLRVYAKDMDSRFSKRFGQGETGEKVFSDWAENFVDFLCGGVADPDLAAYNVNDIMSSCAFLLLKEFEELPDNRFLRIYKNILDIYIP